VPHLQFEINKQATSEQKVAFADRVRQLFADVMNTGTDHISISIREFGTYNLFIGRVKDQEEGVALVNADIREGRDISQRRALALGFLEIINDIWQIPPRNAYVTFTEHKGEDFHLQERYLADWREGENPLED
jgi:phenylpyruvate tautomerase PptA (4-oxalocrotonate tautomerase family)